jgi:O-antigen/teichoic acid export membrane protein
MSKKGTFFLLHSVSLYVPYLADLVLKFFVIRLIAARLGSEILGTWGIFQSVVLFPAFIQQSFSFAVFLQASRKRTQTNIFYDGFFISPLLSIFFGIFMSLFSAKIASVFRIPAPYMEMAIHGFRLTAAVLILGSVSEVFLFLLQARRRFQLAGTLLLASSLINSSLDITFLRAGYGILTLLAIDIATNLLLCIGGGIASHSPRAEKFTFRMRPNAIRDLMKDVKTQLIVRTAASVNWDLDSLIIPRFFGIQTMASYWIARRIPYILKNMIWTGTTPTVPSVDDDASVYEPKLQGIFWLQLFLFLPAAVFLWVFSKDIIQVWIGANYANAADWMRILLFAITMDVLPATFFYFFLAKEKDLYTTRIPVYAAIVKLSVSVVACWTKNIELLLFATAAGSLLFIFAMFRAVLKETQLSFRSLIQPLLGAGLSCAIASFICLNLPTPLSILQILIFVFAFGGIAYGLSLIIFWRFYPEVFSVLMANFKGLVSAGIKRQETA